MLDGHLPANWDRFLEDFPVDVKGLATRKSNSICLNQVAEGQWGRWGEALMLPLGLRIRDSWRGLYTRGL